MDSNTRNEDESSSTSSDETSFTFDGRVRDEIPTNVAHLKILSSVDWSFPSYDFLELERLVHVTFEHGIKTIGDYAFMYCESLREVSIPPTVWIIEAGAFYECGSLVNVELHEGLIEIACEAFACCKSLSHVSIPSTVQTIDDEAFRDCASLCVVSIPSSTETVGERAFAGCESLLAVEFSKEPSLKTLYSSCFDECPALVNVFLPFPIEDIEFLDRDDSSAIANRLASKHADGSPLSRIVNRYAQLPIHKCCYYSSSSTASELENLLKASNDIDNHQNDDFGMSPFHIVATSANLRVDLFQMLLDAYPTDVLSQRDTNGKTMLDYLLVNSTPGSVLLIKLVLQKTIIEKMSRFGMEPWTMQLLSLIESSSLNWNSNLETRRQCLYSVLAKLSLYVMVEAIPVLELALWKEKLKPLREIDESLFVGRNTMQRKVDRHNCRVTNGASIVIPSVIGFLGRKSATVPFDLSMLPLGVSWMKAEKID